MDDFLIELLETDFPDWEYVDESVLCCPHGHNIEWDGRCPEGCESPLLTMGLI